MGLGFCGGLLTDVQIYSECFYALGLAGFARALKSIGCESESADYFAEVRVDHYAGNWSSCS
jgi:hypothetical protein